MYAQLTKWKRNAIYDHKSNDDQTLVFTRFICKQLSFEMPFDSSLCVEVQFKRKIDKWKNNDHLTQVWHWRMPTSLAALCFWRKIKTKSKTIKTKTNNHFKLIWEKCCDKSSNCLFDDGDFSAKRQRKEKRNWLHISNPAPIDAPLNFV